MSMSPTDLSLQSFRAFFAAKTNWCTGTLSDNGGNHCALGHLRPTDIAIHPITTDKGKALSDAFAPLATDSLACEATRNWGALSKTTWGLYGITQRMNVGQIVLVAVNNGNHPAYQQPDPRARILAAIDDLIAMEAACRDAALDAIETRALVPVTNPQLVTA